MPYQAFVKRFILKKGTYENVLLMLLRAYKTFEEHLNGKTRLLFQTSRKIVQIHISTRPSPSSIGDDAHWFARITEVRED
jgi:hypothetical protein